jgi:hypothetical protein
MRTTVDLEDNLMQAAKVRAATRGETLKDLIARAVAREVDTARTGKHGRARFPLFGSPDGPSVLITNEDIDDVLTAEEVQRHYEQ